MEQRSLGSTGLTVSALGFGCGAVGGLLVVLGIIFAAHYGDYIVLAIGAVIVLATMFFWWRDVIRESRTPGLHSPVVRLGLRYGMTFFIASEVMFFVG